MMRLLHRITRGRLGRHRLEDGRCPDCGAIYNYPRCGPRLGLWVRLGIIRLFCHHRKLVFQRNIYGDEIFEWNGNRSVWLCWDCGSLIGRRLPELSSLVSQSTSKTDSTTTAAAATPATASQDDPPPPEGAV